MCTSICLVACLAFLSASAQSAERVLVGAVVVPSSRTKEAPKAKADATPWTAPVIRPVESENMKTLLAPAADAPGSFSKEFFRIEAPRPTAPPPLRVGGC
jgi:hypothetical protein